MRVLVTGATSMTGSAVIERLEARGDSVRSFQRRSSGRPDELLGDVADPVAVAEALDGVEAVIHLAAKVGVVGRLEDYERINLGGTRTLVDAAVARGIERFVHVSSPSVAHAGDALVGAAAETADPGTARGPYAISKAKAELVALDASSSRFPLVAIRPHLVWGPGDTQLIGRIVDRARQGRLALVGSGAALIDTTYVDNAADALVAALDRCHDLSGRALVVSNGQPRTVAELVGRITQATGVDAPRRRLPAGLAVAGGRGIEWLWNRRERDDDPPMTGFLAEQLSTAHWFAQSETRRLLGWRPAVDLDEGFARLAASYR